jgi:hypothetical protein
MRSLAVWRLFVVRSVLVLRVRIRSSSRSIFQSRNFSSAFGAVFDLCFFAAAGLALGDSVPTRFLSALHRSRVSASQCPADFSSQGFLSFRTGVCFTDFRADFSRWRRDLSAMSRFLFRFGLVLVRAGAVNTPFAISAPRLLTVFCSGLPLFWIRF